MIKSTRSLHVSVAKKKPQDATLRNVRASRKTEAELRMAVQDLEDRLTKLAARVYKLEHAPHAHRNHD